MYNNEFLNQLPLPAIFLITLLVAAFCFEFGFRIGKGNRRVEENFGPLTTAAWIINSFLVFMVTFTFGLAASNVTLRKRLVVEEASAIREAYLDADFLKEPSRTDFRNILNEYLHLRLEVVRKGKLEWKKVLDRTSELQTLLWSKAVLETKANPNSENSKRYIHSLHNVFDLHTKRLTAFSESHIQTPIVISLDLLAVISTFMIGYFFGLMKSRRWISTIALILALGIVRTLISGLNRPENGLAQISQQALIILGQEMDGQKP